MHMPIRAAHWHPMVVLAVATLSIGLVGCSHVHTVKVDAIRAPEHAPRRTFHVVAADSAAPTDAGTFAAARAMVDRALEMNGLFPASRPEWADVIVELRLEMSPMRLIAEPDTRFADDGATMIFYPDGSGGSLTETSGYYVPAASLKRLVPVWEKRLSLLACENLPTPRNPQHPGAELWRVDVSVQDGSSSFDGLLPVLVAAVLDSVDRDIGPGTMRRIAEDSASALVVSQLD